MSRGILLQIDDPVDSLMNSATPIEKKCARFAPVDAKSQKSIITIPVVKIYLKCINDFLEEIYLKILLVNNT